MEDVEMTTASKDPTRTVPKKGKRSLSQYITPKDVYSKKVRDSQSSGTDRSKGASSLGSTGASFGSLKSAASVASSASTYTRSALSEESPEDVEGEMNVDEAVDDHNNNTEELDEDFMVEMARIDREFLDHQILLLSTPFSVPEIARNWGKGHIPVKVMEAAIHKMNMKYDDQMRRRFTPQALRKLLLDLSDARRQLVLTQADIKTHTSENKKLNGLPLHWPDQSGEDQDLTESYNEASERVASLQDELKKKREKLQQYENLAELADQVEKGAEDMALNLKKEIRRNQMLVKKVIQRLRKS